MRSDKGRKMKKKDLLLILIVCIVCLFVMLPRILSAQFGLLDDGALLLTAEYALSDLSSILYQFQAAGRFLPTVSLLRVFVFSFAGFEPQRWYIWSAFVLIIICFEMIYIIRQYNFSRMQALLSALFFVASPTVIESFYTLSKSEIPLLLLIASAILLATTYTSLSNPLTKIFIVIICFVHLLLSFGAKETAIVLPFLFLSWLLISWIYFRKTGEYRNLMQSDGILLVGSLIGCILYWTFRSMLGIGNSNYYSVDYQPLNIDKILFNFKALLGWLIRDYPYLLPTLLGIYFLKPLRNIKNTFFTWRLLSWMGAWALILLPWNYVSYYFLPFSFGSALFGGLILGEMLSLLLSKDSLDSKAYFEKYPAISRMTNRYRLGVFCVASLLLFIPPTLNAAAYATEQLVFDRANWQLVEQVTKLPKNSRLLVNLPSQHEYFFELGLFVGPILNRTDISIEAYQPQMVLDHEQDIYLASPAFVNQVLPRVRALNGLDVIESGRSLKNMTRDSELIYSTRIKRPVVDIGFHRILSFLKIGDMIGNSNRNVFVSTVINYGWDLWKYSSSK
jgi:hypothetical protein